MLLTVRKAWGIQNQSKLTSKQILRDNKHIKASKLPESLIGKAWGWAGERLRACTDRHLIKNDIYGGYGVMIKIRELSDRLTNGSFDEKLAALYCRPVTELSYYKNRIEHLTELFCESFAADREREIAICSAAGRTEIGGNHTDHQRGRVLTGSVDLDALACIAENGTTMIRIFSEGFGETDVDLTNLEVVEEEKNSTASLIRGIAARIASFGYEVRGFDACVISDVPGGSGLSSSACFEILIGEAMNKLFCDLKLSMVDLAKIGQYAENVFFGKPSGLMDQMGCAVGGIITINFKDKENPEIHPVEVDFSKAGYALCIIDSGADHADLTDDYAAIPAEMRAVAACLGKEVLSETEESAFYAALPEIQKKVGDRAVLRAVHYFKDCAHVQAQVAALEKGDFDGFLELVRRSGVSSYEYLQNICTYRDPAQQPVAVALAIAEHALNGKGAVRVHGGGFAGTIQAFVPMNQVDAFRKEVDAGLFEGACRITYIRPVGGCVLAD